MILQSGTAGRKPPAYGIGSVDKALRLLWMFHQRPRWTVAEAGDALGVARSTAHRILAMLQHHGFVMQDPVSKAYGPGRALLGIGLAAIQGLDVRNVARPELEALARETGETVQLIILQGPRTLIVDSVESTEIVRVGARTGGSAPAHCTSAGKVLLAALPLDRVRALVGDDPLETLTPRSIATFAELSAELEQIREQGYATNFQEHEPGATALSVAVPVPPDATPAAVAVMGPSMRMEPARVPALAGATRAAAERIARRLEEA